MLIFELNNGIIRYPSLKQFIGMQYQPNLQSFLNPFSWSNTLKRKKMLSGQNILKSHSKLKIGLKPLFLTMTDLKTLLFSSSSCGEPRSETSTYGSATSLISFSSSGRSCCPLITVILTMLTIRLKSLMYL